MYHVKTLPKPPARNPVVPSVKLGLDWEAGGWAGLGAGAVFIALQTFLGAALGGGGNTDAVRRIASVALGDSVVPATAPFSALVFFAAAAVHIPLSLIYARILAAMIDGMSLAKASVAGALFGGALYFVNYYALSGLFPWFAAARGAAAIVSHLAFGVMAASIYVQLARGRGEFR